MAITRKKNLGLLLIEAGIIEPEQLEQALLKQSKEINSGYIGDILIKAGLIDEKTRNRFLSQQLHIPTVELGHFEVDKSVLEMIPERIVREYNVLPIFNLNNTINVDYNYLINIGKKLISLIPFIDAKRKNELTNKYINFYNIPNN